MVSIKHTRKVNFFSQHYLVRDSDVDHFNKNDSQFLFIFGYRWEDLEEYVFINGYKIVNDMIEGQL